MKILILGSEGFIGRHCVNYFSQKGWEVYGCDLVDYSSGSYQYTKISRLTPDFDLLFTLARYDVCINAAGNGSVPLSIDYPVNDFEANCTDVIKVVELIRLKNRNCKYLHISSAAVYGNPSRLPVKEEDRILPLSPYGWHKRIAEEICREYHHLHGIKVAIVRPFSIYGPGLHKQLFYDLFQKCKNAPDELLLWGTGNESRDFIYIDDVIAALHLIIEYSPMDADVYNLANGIEITISAAAGTFIEHFNKQIRLKFNNQQRPGDPLNWLADITSIKSLGYVGKTDIQTGISNYVNWLRTLS
jgi:dTDP-glucose 4,6-dehydratase/UDP-glucose 4-epimerase